MYIILILFILLLLHQLYLNGKTIKEAKYLKKDDEINIKLFDGQVNAKILKKECEEE